MHTAPCRDASGDNGTSSSSGDSIRNRDTIILIVVVFTLVFAAIGIAFGILWRRMRKLSAAQEMRDAAGGDGTSPLLGGLGSSFNEYTMGDAGDSFGEPNAFHANSMRSGHDGDAAPYGNLYLRFQGAHNGGGGSSGSGSGSGGAGAGGGVYDNVRQLARGATHGQYEKLSFLRSPQFTGSAAASAEASTAAARRAAPANVATYERASDSLGGRAADRGNGSGNGNGSSGSGSGGVYESARHSLLGDAPHYDAVFDASARRGESATTVPSEAGS